MIRCGTRVGLGFALALALVMIYTGYALSAVSEAAGQGK